jgi:phosphoribosylaminoimidazole-succinocarboxamide synthase
LLTEAQILAVLPCALDKVDIPGRPVSRGKVRDSYKLPNQRRMLITTDRLSAFDRVLGQVPYKGQVLNQLAAWWFEQTSDILHNHVMLVPDPNVTIAQEATPLPVEVVVRGYISGVTSTSLWTRYATGERVIYGLEFPDGLRKNQPLPEPIITPTSKEIEGHDQRLTVREVVEDGWVDAATWYKIETVAIALFKRGQQLAARAGLILVDTKYEFGLDKHGDVMLIDEIHTPDSSRFWQKSTYTARFEAGEEPDNFDKELIRLWYTNQGYGGEGEPPPMATDLIVAASRRYIEVYERMTGEEFIPAEYPAKDRILRNLRQAGVLA